MKGKSGPASTVLRPVLDTYMDAAVALVGCASRGIERYSCEYDVLIVAKERQAPTTIRIGDVFVDLTFVSENDVLKPGNPEHALALSFAKPIRDTSLVLSTASAATAAVLSESARKASRARLSSALKILGRSEEAFSRKSFVDADFWLLAGTYEFAFSWLLSKEVVPSPSHLLSQLRGISKGSPRAFEGFSIGAGLESAGRAGCGARLEGVAVLHDLLRERSDAGAGTQTWKKERTDLLAAKAKELITRIELAECYSFLGQELVSDLLAVLRVASRTAVSSLTSGKEPLLGERLVRQLGLARNERSIRVGLDSMKEQVSVLARKP